jgi:cholesterol transport system auxiliary component
MAGSLNKLLCGVSTLALASCSVLSPVQSLSTSTYVINTVPHVAQHAAHKTTLLVAMPQTNPIYNSTDMAYMAKPYQVGYFAKNNWAATPAQMLQTLMVQTLQNTQHYSNVTASIGVGTATYSLTTEIVDFHQDFLHAGSEYYLTVRAQLVMTATNVVVAAHEFKIVEPASQNTPLGGVYAANQASAKFLRQLSEFCIRHTR